MQQGPLSQRAWLAVRLGFEEAARQGRPVASSHLLLGLVRERENLGADALRRIGVDPSALEGSLQRLWREGPREGAGRPMPWNWWQPSPWSRVADAFLARFRGWSPVAQEEEAVRGAPFTSDAREALLLAVRAAREDGRLFAGTEHLLLGLAGARSGRAGRLLEHLGAVPARIRAALEETAGRG